MNIFNGMKTYAFGIGTIGAVIASYFGTGMPLQQGAVYVLGSLMIMAMRHGISTTMIKMGQTAVDEAAILIPDPALKAIASIVDQSVTNALNNAAAAAAKPAAK